jgi:hypothetical protein
VSSPNHPSQLAPEERRRRLAVLFATRLLGPFPHSLHEDTLAAVGLECESVPRTRTKRDPEFRQRVLVAYE